MPEKSVHKPIKGTNVQYENLALDNFGNVVDVVRFGAAQSADTTTSSLRGRGVSTKQLLLLCLLHALYSEIAGAQAVVELGSDVSVVRLGEHDATMTRSRFSLSMSS